MTFNPQLLLDLADDLCVDVDYEDEPRYRTSISRAYYAAHLTARSKFESNGVVFNKDYSVHQQVVDHLNIQNKVLGGMLYRLRKERNKADYVLTSQVHKGPALSCLRSARHIITNL